VGQGTRGTLADWGIAAERIAALFASGVIVEAAQQKVSAG
jgi:hypothetical protein